MTTLRDACVRISSAALTAWVHPLGAELRGLRSAAGHELLWHGDADWWERSAPILFPVIGRLRDGRSWYRGRPLPMEPHGFALQERFELTHSEAGACSWRLHASERTRTIYPFDFALDVSYRLSAATLTIEATVHNLGSEVLPFSIGFHPALRWPILGVERGGHVLRFTHAEPCAARRRSASGLTGPPKRRLPLVDRSLELDDGLFRDGAQILDAVCSHGLTYADRDGPLIDIGWRNLPQFALWSKPGAPFICIEPWRGMPDLDGADAHALPDRPLSVLLPPAQLESVAMHMAVDRRLCQGAMRTFGAAKEALPASPPRT